eukprot:scaffold21500_cov58-Attheya_sp.AAC.1
MATSIFASLLICECKTKHRTRPSNPPLCERLPGPSTPHQRQVCTMRGWHRPQSLELITPVG